MTEKLYYLDSHMTEFDAAVISCEQTKNGWAAVLDRSAFFPEGGGQLADTGIIGDAAVSDVHEKGNIIYHYVNQYISPGTQVHCRIDAEQRLRRMQNHSGEHIVSGITHRLHGCDNVGFHMGAECMTIDFDTQLTWDELCEIERLANLTVRNNVPIRTWFPSPEELVSLSYRSKLELTENVRIVEIEGVDRCACCAPHVKHTGEVGLIKILDFMRHRSGVRVSLVCGMDALDAVNTMQRNVSGISSLLSAKRENTADAVRRVLAQQEKLKLRNAELGMRLAVIISEQYKPTPGNICVFDDTLDEVSQRELVNMLADKCGGIAAVFCGSDGQGYRYIIGSRNADLRANAKSINSGIGGRGGGSRDMIQGRAAETAENIKNFVEAYYV